jgi:hypothetical protein
MCSIKVLSIVLIYNKKSPCKCRGFFGEVGLKAMGFSRSSQSGEPDAH